jgi:hypothetical protein
VFDSGLLHLWIGEGKADVRDVTGCLSKGNIANPVNVSAAPDKTGDTLFVLKVTAILVQ